MYDSYVITSSCREAVRRFQANYPGVRVPSRGAVRLPARATAGQVVQ